MSEERRDEPAVADEPTFADEPAIADEPAAADEFAGSAHGAADDAYAALDDGTEESEIDHVAEVARLALEAQDLRDRTLRTLADFDNYRKRAEREREELRKYALTDALRDLLPVVDNLERAATAEGGLDDLRRGVEMTMRQLLEVLRRFGAREVAALGQPFDPRLHEAVMRTEDAEVSEPTVVNELQRGFVLHDRILRPAMVVVAMPAETTEVGEAESERSGA